MSELISCRACRSWSFHTEPQEPEPDEEGYRIYEFTCDRCGQKVRMRLEGY